MTTSTLTPHDGRPPRRHDDPRPLRVLLLIGSVRHGRIGPVPAAWMAERIRERDDLHLDVVDLATIDLPTVLPDADDPAALPEAVVDVGRRVDAADAVVVVTPVYNRGYPASLKNAIDWFHTEWRRTPIGFVSYGGRTGGIEAVEQLRTVFVELGTMTIRPVVSFPDVWDRFDDQGHPTDPEAAAGAATAFLDELVWWAAALRTATAEVGR